MNTIIGAENAAEKECKMFYQDPWLPDMNKLFHFYPTEYFDHNNVAMIGVGGCGANCLELIAGQKEMSIPLITVNNDKLRLFQNSGGISNIFLLGDPENQKEAKDLFVAVHEQLLSKLVGIDMVYLFCSLNGKLGGWVGPEVLSFLQSIEKSIVLVLFEPFDFEYEYFNERIQEATKGMENADLLIRCSNQKFVQGGLKGVTMSDSFELMTKLVVQSLPRIVQGKEPLHTWMTVSGEIV